MKATHRVIVCIIALCSVEEICCKALVKEANTKAPVEKNPSLDVPTTKMAPSGREADVDDTNDLVIHDRKDLLETTEPCGKAGVTCRRRKKRQFSKMLDAQRRPEPGTNGVYDLPTLSKVVNEISSHNVSEDNEDDDDDIDEDEHMLILRQRKRRDFDITSDDSDEVNMLDDIEGDKPSYSGIPSFYMHGKDDIDVRLKRDILSDSSLGYDLETDSDDEDLSLSSDDTSLSLLKSRQKRETDNSSLDTFEEENDEIFDDVDGDDNGSDSNDFDQKTVTKGHLKGVPNNYVLREPSNQNKLKEEEVITNDLKSEEKDKTLNENRTTDIHNKQMISERGPAMQDKNADNDTSSSNAQNSGPETESDADLSDIPFDAHSVVVLDRVPRDSLEVMAYEEDDPNSGYLEWEAWDPCSVTCGVGRTTRRRVCTDLTHCRDGDVEIEACVLDEKYEC